MKSKLHSVARIRALSSLKTQPCVRAILGADLPSGLKIEMESFIRRNVIADCGRVSPHCLKAHLVKTGKDMRLSEKKIEELMKLFKGEIGWKGYYLDSGKLKKV
jgi:hypothetical protein